MTKAEQRARRFAEYAEGRGGLEVTLTVEHREPTYWTYQGEQLVLSDGRTIASVAVRERASYGTGAIYATWSTGDGLGERRRTTSFHGRLYHGSGKRAALGRRIRERDAYSWAGILGDKRLEER